MLLILGLPFYLVLVGTFTVFLAKKIIFGQVFALGILAKGSLGGLLLLSIALFTYLFYWLVLVVLTLRKK